MSKKIRLIRDLSYLDELKVGSDCIVISDSPLIRSHLENMGHKVLDTSRFTGSGFWSDVIFLREKILNNIDVLSFLRETNLPLSLEASLKFHLRFALSELSYELKLADVLCQKFDCKSIYFDAGFVTGSIRENFGKDVTETEHFKKSHRLMSFLQTCLFNVSLLWGKLFFKQGILVASLGSGLSGIISRISSFSGYDKTISLIGTTTGSGLKKKFVGKIKKGFHRSGCLEWLALPSVYSFLSKLDTSKVKLKYLDQAGGLNHDFFPVKNYGLDFISERSVTQWIEHSVCNWAAGRQRDIYVAECVIKSISPKLILAQHSLDMSACLAHVAKQFSVPTVLISHGSHVINSDPIANKEWLDHSKTMFDGPFDLTALQTPAACKFYDESNCQAGAFLSGPLIVSGSRGENNVAKRRELFGDNANKLILLHAGTPKPPSALRPLIYETVDEYLENIKGFVEAVCHNPHVHAAIRLRPQWGITPELIEKALPKSGSWAVYASGDFNDYLEQSDALVSYSSTTLEQAFFANKPVILWNSMVQYNHFSAVAIRGEEQLKGVWWSNKDTIEKDLLEISTWDSDNRISGSIQSIYCDFDRQTSATRTDLLNSIMGALSD
ncbi:hypothetical protein C0J08_03620 [Marinomonas sp. CT5]|uniref:hypothetical protein n=1 Tax=Marinomonas sp. CT5 TaxID=2066133 RepID=UPI001BB0B378|nr:hypothetical protein [Marinomonas sp. CT5]QUX94554.1 hypothetical protein C0J08_03620 [Marinomonas sp. CT5]